MTISKRLKERADKFGFIYNERYYPYNPNLTDKAKLLRKNMTEPEKRLWFYFLRFQKPRFFRQFPIDFFIVDFSCPTYRLIVEIDGESHHQTEVMSIDRERDSILREYYNFEVLRFSNNEIMENLDGVCTNLSTAIALKQNPPATPLPPPF